jgi:alternate signal-mediated exported protein
MVIMATFAWFTANDSVKNHLETAMITDGSAKIVEVFTPPVDWAPGQKVTKKVSVANDGTGDILARVSFEEMMSLLKVPASAKDKALSGTAEIPQTVNPKNYDDAAGYKKASDIFKTVTNLPAGVTLRAKEDSTGTKKAYSFVAYYEVKGGAHNGKFQRVTADYTVNGDEVIVSNVKYWSFDGKDGSEAAWAKFAAPKTKAQVTKPAVNAIGNPITDKNKKITLDYTDKNAVSAKSPADGKWWYNENDGFFYYIGKIAPGTSSTTLLDSLTLDPSADQAYSGMEFDLIVNMEAIQNSTAALTSATGWNLNASSDSALITALTKYCL